MVLNKRPQNEATLHAVPRIGAENCSGVLEQEVKSARADGQLENEVLHWMALIAALISGQSWLL